MSARGKERAAEENKEGFSEEEEERRSVEEEDLEEVMREAASSAAARRKHEPTKQQIILNIPEAVDDFLRNFLRRAGLSQTLDTFEAEWYGSAQKLLTETLTPAPAGVFFISDALTHRQLLQSQLQTVRRETELLRQQVLAQGESLVRMQRERDFHRLQYRRVAESKNRLIEDFKQLKKLLQSYEPALRQLDDKYQAALRHKMLISLEKDRVQNTTDPRLSQEKPRNKTERSIKKSADKWSASTTRHPTVCSRPVDLHLAQVASQKSFSLSCSIKAHELPISCIDLHPRKLILASASDDRSWRLWTLPAGGEEVPDSSYCTDTCTCIYERGHHEITYRVG